VVTVPGTDCTDRGQAHTLEGFVAALVVASGVVFALNATAVTPLTASTSNQHIENQQLATAEDLLAAEAANGTLRGAVLYWNRSRGAFRDSGPRGVYPNGGPPTAFGGALNETFGADRIAFDVEVRYRTVNDTRGSARMVDMGNPTDNAVAATRTVAVFDDAPIAGGTGNVSAAASSGEFYAPDAAPDGPLFNVLEVRIVVWRI
jgi:hypothetical protein